MTLLLVGWAVTLEGCNGSLPPVPDINLYNHHQKAAIALCSKVKDNSRCDSVDIKDTDKWYMLTPSGLEALQNYIDELIRKLEADLLEMEGLLDDTSFQRAQIVIRAQDLRKTRDKLRQLKRSFRLPQALYP